MLESHTQKNKPQAHHNRRVLFHSPPLFILDLGFGHAELVEHPVQAVDHWWRPAQMHLQLLHAAVQVGNGLPHILGGNAPRVRAVRRVRHKRPVAERGLCGLQLLKVRLRG